MVPPFSLLAILGFVSFFFFFSFLSKNVVLAVLGSLLSLVAAGGCHPLAVVCGLLVVASWEELGL